MTERQKMVSVACFKGQGGDQEVQMASFRVTKGGKAHATDVKTWLRDIGFKVPLHYTRGGVQKTNPDLKWPAEVLLGGVPEEHEHLAPRLHLVGSARWLTDYWGRVLSPEGFPAVLAGPDDDEHPGQWILAPVGGQWVEWLGTEYADYCMYAPASEIKLDLHHVETRNHIRRVLGAPENELVWPAHLDASDRRRLTDGTSWVMAAALHHHALEAT